MTDKPPTEIDLMWHYLTQLSQCVGSLAINLNRPQIEDDLEQYHRNIIQKRNEIRGEMNHDR